MPCLAVIQKRQLETTGFRARLIGDLNCNSSKYFRGAMDAIQALGGTAFMLSPGDIDPVNDTTTIKNLLCQLPLFFLPLL